VLAREAGAESVRQLPTLRLFKIRMDLEMEGGTDALSSAAEVKEPIELAPQPYDELDIAVIRALQGDMAVIEEPYAPAAGKLGMTQERLLDHLARVGPSTTEDLRTELSLKRQELKALRSPLERCGVIVARSVAMTSGREDADGDAGGDGHRHDSELSRWDQAYHGPPAATASTAATAATADPAEAFGDLLVTAVQAAVVAPEPELRRWFSWPWYWTDSLVDDLVRQRRLRRLPHPRYPVECVLEERRDRSIVLRARDENAVMNAEQSLQLDGVRRRALFGFEIAMIERHRIVEQRYAGDVYVEKRKLLGGEGREARIERRGADRTGKNQDFRAAHRCILRRFAAKCYVLR